jgi:pimeloyl-ACP methyl ester carboxylesterase
MRRATENTRFACTIEPAEAEAAARPVDLPHMQAGRDTEVVGFSPPSAPRPAPGVVLVHGAATTGAVWHRVQEALSDVSVIAPTRPMTGDLEREVEWLTTLSDGRAYVGVSGGATLGLALLSRSAGPTLAVLHEPAPGRFAPGLLAPFARAFEDGVDAFGYALYGDAFSEVLDKPPHDTVARELAMFASFEPAQPLADVPIILTVGEHSSPGRHLSVQRLAEFVGATVEVLPGVGHSPHLEASSSFVQLVDSLVSGRSNRRATGPPPGGP